MIENHGLKKFYARTRATHYSHHIRLTEYTSVGNGLVNRVQPVAVLVNLFMLYKLLTKHFFVENKRCIQWNCPITIKYVRLYVIPVTIISHFTILITD